MRLKTELAIKADIESLPPRAWSRKDFQDYLAEKRIGWNAPQCLTAGLLIEFLLDNEIARTAEICSKEYGAKTRYITGKLTILPFACSFYPRSYISHATALHVHGLVPMGKIYVNHEQSPKKTTSRLSQGRIDQAFQNQPRRSSFEFKTEHHTIIFLNGKNTRDAGVIETTGSAGELLRCASLERTLIDCAVRPQYAGGIDALATILPKVVEQISTEELVRLLTQTKYAYPYHQALGFLLERAGVTETRLSPLRRLPRRFKFYLDYGMKHPLYDPEWQIYYPATLK